MRAQLSPIFTAICAFALGVSMSSQDPEKIALLAVLLLITAGFGALTIRDALENARIQGRLDKT